MIPDVVGVVGLAFLSERVGIEVGNCHGVGVKSPNWHILLFLRVICDLFALVSAHKFILHIEISYKGMSDIVRCLSAKAAKS